MARKAKAKPQETPLVPDWVQPVEPSDDAPPISASPAPADDRTPIKRVSFPVDDNGNINWEGMRPSTAQDLRDLLKRVYSDASFMGDLGAKPMPVVEIFDKDWTGSIFDALGAIESLIAQRVYGIPAEIARECFTYNDIEKEKLAGPAAKVINKYATKYDWLVAFKEEIALGLLLFTITSVKLKMAQIRTDAWRAKEKSKANGIEKKPAAVMPEAEAVPVQ